MFVLAYEAKSSRTKNFFRILVTRKLEREQKKNDTEEDGGVREGTRPRPASSMVLLSLSVQAILVLQSQFASIAYQTTAFKSYFTFGLISMVMNSLKLACGFKECSFFSRVTSH